MLPSNTICVSQEGPANALALNKDCSQVVIAGRNVFKVFSIGENEFTEVCNLRVGKNLNLNFSSIDVAWSTIEENTLATAATNGAVVVWNLGRSGRSKQEHVFSDHKRTVNKVSFHLTEPALLISGSQDGMMKCFDLRMKEVARTFISNTESIRDVQFSPHQANTFAAVSENGNVQLWDVRRHERCLQQFTAHSGPVFACDWHPEVPWLATASRDKTIKVWDIHAKPNLEHTIYTIASVGHVKWRPQKKYQVASCALVLDCAVHVWDVRRPHVPLATFAEHRDVTTAIAWQATPHAFLSTSRDCSLYRHRFSEAAHPVLWANPQGVCVSARGELAHAVPERPLPALPALAALASPAAPPPPAPAPPAPPAPSAPAPPATPAAPPAPAPAAHHHPPPGLGRKQPTAGSLCAAAQCALERAFPGGAASSLSRYRAPAGPLLACARRYRMRGAPPHRLAQHNAHVARDHDRHMVAHVWEVVRAVCEWRAAGAPPAPAPPPRRDPPPRLDPPPPMPSYSAVEEEPLEEVEEWAENQFQYSGVLGLPTHSIYIPPAKYAKQLRDDENAGWVSAASAHYVDVDAMDWTLPEEAFPLRTAPPAPAPAHQHQHQHQHQHPHQQPHQHQQPRVHAHTQRSQQLHNDTDADIATVMAGVNIASVSPGGGSSSTSTSTSTSSSSSGTMASCGESAASGGSPGGSASACSAPPPASPTHSKTFTHQTSVTMVEEGDACEGGEGGEAGPLSVRGGGEPVRAPFDMAPVLAAALKHHADLGDVQTAAVVMIALQDHRNDLFPYIDEGLQEQWLLGYIELLQRHKLWNVATEVVRCAWVGSVWSVSQQSTTVAVSCGRCGRRTRPHAACDRCQPRHMPDMCAVCHQMKCRNQHTS